MDALERLAKNIAGIDPDDLFDAAMQQGYIQDFIIRKNTVDQLFRKGIDSDGLPISPSYRPLTVQIKQEQGKPFDRVTLNDTGAFYRSFFVKVGKGEVEIKADPIKDETNLFEKYGEEVVGLTENNKHELAKFIVPEVLAKVKKQLAG